MEGEAVFTVLVALLATGQPTSSAAPAERLRDLPIVISTNETMMLRSSDAQTELYGNRAFDIVAAPAGSPRLSPGLGGGVVIAGGDQGSIFQVGHGLSIVVGSPGPDVVHLWGGANIVLLGDGDDRVEVHAPSVSLVWGGAGNDVRCAHDDAPAGPFWMIDGTTVCKDDDSDALEIIGAVRHHRAVMVHDGEILEGGSNWGGPSQEYTLDVWAVLSGPDPGPIVRVHQPGGHYESDEGWGVTTHPPWSLKQPEFDVGRRVRLRHLDDGVGKLWYFEHDERGPVYGTPVELKPITRP